MKITKVEEKPRWIPLYAVGYGEVFENASGHILIKVNKSKSADHQGFSMTWNRNHSLAFNPKHGTIRAISSKEEVKPLCSEMTVWEDK